MKETKMTSLYDTDDDINMNKSRIPTNCFGACCKTGACVSIIIAYMWLLVFL